MKNKPSFLNVTFQIHVYYTASQEMSIKNYETALIFYWFCFILHTKTVVICLIECYNNREIRRFGVTKGVTGL